MYPLPFPRYSPFVIAKHDEKIISAAKERVRSEKTSPFNFFTSIWYRSVLECFIYLSPFKSNSAFLMYMRNPFETFQEGILPPKFFVVNECPKTNNLVVNRVASGSKRRSRPARSGVGS
jgi:hypothetical protein